MSINTEIFGLVEIKTEIKKFKTFTLHEYVFIGRDGESLRIHAYHNDYDALVLHPKIERTVEHENV